MPRVSIYVKVRNLTLHNPAVYHDTPQFLQLRQKQKDVQQEKAVQVREGGRGREGEREGWRDSTCTMYTTVLILFLYNFLLPPSGWKPEKRTGSLVSAAEEPSSQRHPG